MNRFQEKLKQLEGQNRLRILSSPRGIDFTSNDYLGFRTHLALRNAAIEALENNIDLGAGGSRLLRGNSPEHIALEEFAAQYFGCEKSLFFSSGYQANLAIFATLPQRGDTILFDGFIHASARNGIQSSHATHVRIPHNDLNAYEDVLKAAKGQRWIAVESVYSMDGDLAPLQQLLELAQKYDAYLVIDEAHGTGVFGPNGKGLSEDLPHDRLITLHTCGKALGVAGGLVCASADIIDYLINASRPFIYSTAPMPLQAVLVKRALELLQEEPQRRTQLFELMEITEKALDVPVKSQIVPIILGSDARAVDMATQLQNIGFDVRAIRPPTVPEGTARIRLSLSTNLTPDEIHDLASSLLPRLQEAA